MWLFIILSQILTLTTSAVLLWLILPKRRVSKITIVLAIFIVNNVALLYGLSEFWRERFYVYLVISILQGLMMYAALPTAALVFINRRILKRQSHPKRARVMAVVAYLGIVGLAIFNAYSPVVHELTVTTTKPLDKSMKIALVSDTHLGRWFGNRQLDKLVKVVDAQNPDVVVIAGDIMNDSTSYYDKNDMQKQLSTLSAPLGVYAVLGNHDYSGNQVAITAAVERSGIKVIDNKNVLLDDAIWLIGRSDITDPAPRILAKSLLAQVDTDKPVIFLEHSLESTSALKGLPIDLHLSGHTHGGQIFPLNILLKRFQPLIHGSKKVDETQFLVTSGYGFGAVPFRLGTRSEIWLVTLQSSH